MSADAVHRRPLAATVTVRTALLVAVGFALVVGLLRAGSVPTVVALTGGLAFAWGVGGLDAADHRRRAAGSLALLAGPGVAVAGLTQATGGRWVVTVLVTAVAVVATETTAGFTIDTANRLFDVAKRGGLVMLAGLFLTVVVVPPLVLGIAAFLPRFLLDVVTAYALWAFVALQLLVAAVGLLARAVADALQARDVDVLQPGAGTDASAARSAAARFHLPRWYLAALVLQPVVVLWPPVPRFVESFLAARPALSTVVDVVLGSGVLLLAAGAVATALAGVRLALALQGVVVSLTGDAPAETFADAAGGLVAVALALCAAAVLASGLGAGLAPGRQPVTLFGYVGPSVGLLGGGLVVLVVVAVIFVGAGFALESVAPAGRGFAAGSALLLAATVLDAAALPAVVVLLGAAVALLVWHLGVRAFDLERDLHGVAPTQRSEVVSVTAVGVALAVGVGLALVTGYAVAPLSLAVPTDRALVGLTLVVVAVLALAVALGRSVVDG